MSVALSAISFNRTSGATPGDALNLRRNPFALVAIPEWQRDVTRHFTESAACYALDEIAGQEITVRALVERLDPTLPEAQIRAVPSVGSQGPPWWMPWFPPVVIALVPFWAASWYAASLWLWALEGAEPSAAPANVLGTAGPATARFNSGAHTAVDLDVAGDGLGSRGVGVYGQQWRWEYRSAPQPVWQPFALTQHTIYAIVSRPTAPWVLQPFIAANTQLPWTDVLDVACRWAAGARTRDEAATRVTEAVYNLGRRGLIEYDCVGPGVNDLGTPHYTLIPGTFDCTAFLERLRGGFGNGRLVNCSDCAAMVATFANALGCDLWQSRMLGVVPFPLNPTLTIGSHVWLSACAIGAFAMHEVAWTNDCGEDDDVFDGCLQVDGDADPTRPPHVGRLATGMRFGRQGDGLYRDRLVAPPGRAICTPNPAGRQRRVVI